MRLPKKQTSRVTYYFRPGLGCPLPVVSLDDTLKDFSASPQGGTSEMVRAINSSGRVSYRRQVGIPDYQLSFNTDEVETGRRVNWELLDTMKWSFYIDEIDNLLMFTTTYVECQVESVAVTTDGNGNKSFAITCSCFSKESF